MNKQPFVAVQQLTVESIEGEKMDITQLYYFVETCKYMNYVETADALYVTPQALSKSIKNLEQELGSEIFYRNRNIMSLTEFGELLLEKSKPIVYNFQKLETEMKIISQQHKGKLRVGIIPSAQEIFNSDIIISFLEKHEGVSIELLGIPQDLIEDSLMKQKIDLAVSVKSPQVSSQLEQISIIKTSVCAIMRRSNILYKKKELNITDLKDQTLVLHGDMGYVKDQIANVANEQGFKLNWRLESPYTEINRPFMHKTNCISLGPLAFCEDFSYTDKVGFRPFSKSEGLEWEMQFVFRKEGYPSDIMLAFINHIKQFV